MSTTIFASDPSITYSPQSAWSPNSDGTMTTNNIGASAQLTFNGEFVEVFGTIPPTSKRDTTRPVSNYTLDHATSVVFNTSDFTNNQPITDHVFFQSPGLASGSHSLVITAIATDNQADFVLASIVYDSNFSFANPIPSSSESIPESTPTSFPSSSQTAVSAVGTPVGAIVGGVIAALVLLLVAFMFYRLYRRRKMSILARAQDSVSDYPPSPRPFLLGVPSETRANGGAVWSRESFVSLNLSPALNENSEPSGNSVVWGSIPHSVSTAPAVFGDRSNTSSLVNEKKDGSELVNSAPMPFNIALNRRSTVLTTGTKWTIQSGPPPSWTALSDAPPSYTTR